MKEKKDGGGRWTAAIYQPLNATRRYATAATNGKPEAYACWFSIRKVADAGRCFSELFPRSESTQKYGTFRVRTSSRSVRTRIPITFRGSVVGARGAFGYKRVREAFAAPAVEVSKGLERRDQSPRPAQEARGEDGFI